MSKIITFAEFKAETANCWDDRIFIDKVMIEAYYCPKCGKSLEYVGRSTVTEYKAFGVCEKDDYAKHFWSEKSELLKIKKRICKAVQAANN